MRITAARLLTAWATLLLVSGRATAQVTTGLPPLGSFSGGPFDTVNNANLNAHFEIPVLNKAGRGVPFQYALSYDSSVWYQVLNTGRYYWEPVANFGWRDVTEASYGYVSYNLTTQTCGSGQQLTYSGWTYHDARGVPHSLPATYQNQTTTLVDSSDCSGGSNHSGGPWPASDGSGYSLSVNTANLNGTSAGSATVSEKSGITLIVPTVVTSGTMLGNPCTAASTICDPNGNYIGASATTSNNIITTTFTDTLGTTALTTTAAVTQNPTSLTPATYTYTGPSGRASVTVNYGYFVIWTGFGCSGVIDYSRWAPLVTSISLPDGTSYSFTYETSPRNSNDVTGRLASVTLPTGGMIQYQYTGANNGIECGDGSAAGLTRTVSGPGLSTATWTYTRSSTPGLEYSARNSDRWARLFSGDYFRFSGNL